MPESAPTYDDFGQETPVHTLALDTTAHKPYDWNVMLDTTTAEKVENLATAQFQMELPAVEIPRNSCEQGCAALMKRREEGCDHIRRRAALWLNSHGCPFYN